MAQLIKDDAGIPIPQHSTEDGISFEQTKGRNGAMFVEVVGLEKKLDEVISAIQALQQAIVNAINSLNSNT